MGDRNPSTSSSGAPGDAAARKKEYYAKRDATKVYLLERFARWREFKSKHKLKTDADVAKMLLDSFDATELLQPLCHVETQTEDDQMTSGSITTPRISEVPSVLPSPIQKSTPRQSSLSGQNTRRQLLSDSSTISVINPMESSEEEDDSDSDTLTAFETHESMTLGLDHTTVGEDDIFNITIKGHDGDEPEDEDMDTERPPNMTVPRPVPQYISTVENVTPEAAIQMEKCIVFTDTLMSLITSLHGSVCKHPNCGRSLEYRKTYAGTCLVVSWRCNAGHFGGRWAAQPSCNKLRAGNLILGSALLLSGNSYTKVGLMFNFCNLQFFSSTLYNQYQQLYIAPAINKLWEQHRQQLWEEKAGKDVMLSGDGRNDSPGHSAQYCTYSLADMEDQAILQMSVVDVREAGGKSNNMERIGFERGMKSLLNSPMVLKEVVTDGHLEIAALMKRKEEYKIILHQNDVWHGGKNLAKKINAAAKTKANQDLVIFLVFWAASIRNYFWHCSKTCGNDAKNFKDKWIGILHHVADEHEWILAEGINGGRCAHEQLSDEDRKKPWLKKESPAHKALTKIVMDTRFLNTLVYYTHFRHIGFLESFHNQILMYASKRHSYSFTTYRARNQLAALDFNHHRGRASATTSDGKPRLERIFSKRTKRWCLVHVLEPKQYEYIPQLLMKVFETRACCEGTVDKRIGLQSDDPRRIAPNIAAIPPPSVQSLVESHQSRF